MSIGTALIDIILKRKDHWEKDQISYIHTIVENILQQEQDDVFLPRRKIRVQGFPERMRAKAKGDKAPICLHAQVIRIGNMPEFKAQMPNTRESNKVLTAQDPFSPTNQNFTPTATSNVVRTNKNKQGADDNTRFSKFVEFLLSEFGGYEKLSQKPVLDIAGGAGGLAFELCMRHEIEAVVVDTREVKFNGRQNRHLRFRQTCLKQLANDPHRTAHKSLLKRNLQSRFRTHDFVQLNTLLDSSVVLPGNDHDIMISNTANSPRSNDEEKLRSILLNRECSVMVGLHPDQATDAIVDIGLALQIPWAVVPCCVFPNLFTRRKLADGRTVRNYDDLCDYIRQKDPNIHESILPCRGRNVVLYWHPSSLASTS